MSIFKAALATVVAGGAVIAISSTAFATTVATSAASPTPTPTPNGKSSTVSVPCGKSATVTNSAWKAGSTAVIKQTAVPSGALKARDVSIVLKATAQSVTIRDFRPASTVAVATLPQTGGGMPIWPLAMALAGLSLIGFGKLLIDRRSRA